MIAASTDVINQVRENGLAYLALQTILTWHTNESKVKNDSAEGESQRQGSGL